MKLILEFLKFSGPTGKTGKYFKCPVFFFNLINKAIHNLSKRLTFTHIVTYNFSGRLDNEKMLDDNHDILMMRSLTAINRWQ